MPHVLVLKILVIVWGTQPFLQRIMYKPSWVEVSRHPTLLFWWLTDLLSVRKEEILGLTVLLISFKQYDRGSRPNLGEGGPLAGKGAGDGENGERVEGDNWGGRKPKYQHPSMRYAGRVVYRMCERRNKKEGRWGRQKQTRWQGKEKDTINTLKHTTKPGRQHRSKPGIWAWRAWKHTSGSLALIETHRHTHFKKSKQSTTAPKLLP